MKNKLLLYAVGIILFMVLVACCIMGIYKSYHVISKPISMEESTPLKDTRVIPKRTTWDIDKIKKEKSAKPIAASAQVKMKPEDEKAFLESLDKDIEKAKEGLKSDPKNITMERKLAVLEMMRASAVGDHEEFKRKMTELSSNSKPLPK